MANLNVWANSIDTPGNVCRDARLRDHETTSIFSGRPILYSDRHWGDAGWHIGLQYRDLHDLADQLEGLHLPEYVASDGHRIRRGELQRLAINAHGNSGVVYVAGQSNDADALRVSTIERHRRDLVRIGLLTRQDRRSYIYLMGCIAGLSAAGTELLVALSRVWPGRYVVGFVSTGVAIGGRMMRPGQHCTEPGMRDSRYPFSLTPEMQERQYGASWENLTELPWADHRSPSAKVALDGRLIRGAIFDEARD